MLLQEDKDGLCELTNKRKRYPSSRLELLAVIWAVGQLHHFLHTWNPVQGRDRLQRSYLPG